MIGASCARLCGYPLRWPGGHAARPNPPSVSRRRQESIVSRCGAGRAGRCARSPDRARRSSRSPDLAAGGSPQVSGRSGAGAGSGPRAVESGPHGRREIAPGPVRGRETRDSRLRRGAGRETRARHSSGAGAGSGDPHSIEPRTERVRPAHSSRPTHSIGVGRPAHKA